MSKPVFIKFGDIRIKLKNIKNYGLDKIEKSIVVFAVCNIEWYSPVSDPDYAVIESTKGNIIEVENINRFNRD